ncbi:hypothetical protein [Streptomyces sp. NPDC048192]|jgi:hypothetical protein|uniref:hypothetical protein n=1 Tax=Streptomyces sp. NPDC048192 TaxID=3365510 RepID=UPI0037141212
MDIQQIRTLKSSGQSFAAALTAAVLASCGAAGTEDPDAAPGTPAPDPVPDGQTAEPAPPVPATGPVTPGPRPQGHTDGLALLLLHTVDTPARQ